MRVARRLSFIAVMIAVLSVVLFYLLHVLPGSPEDALLAASPDVRAEDVARLRSLRGLDRPILEQYGCWLFGRGDVSPAARCAYWPTERGILAGELGYSRHYKMGVGALLAERLPRTLALMVPAFSIAVALAVGLGAASALAPGRTVDRLISLACFMGMSVPAHWLSLLVILVFSVELGVLPAGGVRDPRAPDMVSTISHAILPVSVLSFGFAMRWTRHVRASVLEVVELDFVRAARAKGLTERAIFARHVLPNALLPLLTVVAQSAPALFSGALVVETVFSYPGMGVLIFESIVRDDHLVAIVVSLAYALVTMVATLAADLLYGALDPRLREAPAATGAASRQAA